MKVFIKFDFNTACKKILEEKLEECQIKHRILGFGEVEFLERVSPEKLELFSQSLGSYGIEIVKIPTVRIVFISYLRHFICLIFSIF